MKMNEYDILEECLKALDNGQTVESVLARYPDRARELRPLLNTAIRAGTLGGVPVPEQFQKRDRNRLIRRAAEMRESKRPARRMILLFPRLAVLLGVIGALILSSTGLVSASGSSIPGDQLYPVKRTWEGVRLLFVFTSQEREILQSQYEQERLNEADELLNMGRSSTRVTFSGVVTQQQDGSWKVSGIPVSVSNSTTLPKGTITDSAPVVVTGITRSNGVVEAQEIQLLQPGAPLPPFEPEGSGERDSSNPASMSTPITPAMPTGSPMPQPSAPQDQHSSYEFSGIVESMQNNVWTINGQSVRMDQARVNGDAQIGSSVKFQGYYDTNGEFIVYELDVTSSGDSSSSRRNDNGGSLVSPTRAGDKGGGETPKPGDGMPTPESGD